jgi:dUTP pyrophosphatase
MPDIPLKRLHDEARFPTRATAGSFGYDLATVTAETVGTRETKIVSCGFQLAEDLTLDDTRGLAMLILPRSSLPLTYGLILPNAPGLVDADYSGPLSVIVHNLRDEPVALPAGTRIAQALFVEVRLPRLREVGEANPHRERGGFGSTGQ